jgi:DNA-binding CsgD family transcriptional regulator
VKVACVSLHNPDGPKPGPTPEPRSFAPRVITRRQLECFYWVDRGKSANDIGTILSISRRTVENHLYRACETLGVSTRLQAVVLLREMGLLGPGASVNLLSAAE